MNAFHKLGTLDAPPQYGSRRRRHGRQRQRRRWCRNSRAAASNSETSSSSRHRLWYLFRLSVSTSKPAPHYRFKRTMLDSAGLTTGSSTSHMAKRHLHDFRYLPKFTFIASEQSHQFLGVGNLLAGGHTPPEAGVEMEVINMGSSRHLTRPTLNADPSGSGWQYGGITAWTQDWSRLLRWESPQLPTPRPLEPVCAWRYAQTSFFIGN